MYYLMSSFKAYWTLVVAANVLLLLFNQFCCVIWFLYTACATSSLKYSNCASL